MTTLRRTNYGFKQERFTTPEFAIKAKGLGSGYIESALNQAIMNGGGVVILPAGSGTLTRKIKIIGTQNVVLRGAGAGKTTLTCQYDTGQGIEVRDSHNVVIEDLSLLGAGKDLAVGIAVHWSENVLLNRCHVSKFRSAAAQCRFAKHVTVQSCTLTGSTKHHGFATKDIYEPGGRFATENEAKRQYGSNHPHGSRLTSDVAVLDCDLRGNYMYGVNYHGLRAEIAGNQFEIGRNGTHTMKVFDARDVYVHSNTVAGGRFCMVSRTLGSWHKSGQVRIQDNTFKHDAEITINNSGSYGTFPYGNETQIILGKNDGSFTVRNSAPRYALSVCRGVSTHNVSGQYLESVACDDAPPVEPEQPPVEPGPLPNDEILEQLNEIRKMLESIERKMT